jgi:hypothetical protein
LIANIEQQHLQSRYGCHSVIETRSKRENSDHVENATQTITTIITISLYIYIYRGIPLAITIIYINEMRIRTYYTHIIIPIAG